MGFWGDWLFGSDDQDEPVPVTKTLTCPRCRVPSDRTHCTSAGCPWVLCIPCGLVLSPRRTRRWNGPPK